MANVSKRVYIKWNNAENHTNFDDVLVLTSHARTFVDIRIKTEALASPNAERGVFDLTALDWAFAGYSESWVEREGEEDETCRARWIHEVDSMHRDASSVVDQGIMTALSDGTTLENGSMVYPATNEMTEYQEAWTDVPLAFDSSGQKLAMVLRVDDEGSDLRGIVVMVAQYCQGILRCGEHITIESWSFIEGNWKRRIRIGNMFLPCAALFRHEMLEVGSEVRHGNAIWKVTEKHNEAIDPAA